MEQNSQGKPTEETKQILELKETLSLGFFPIWKTENLVLIMFFVSNYIPVIHKDPVMWQVHLLMLFTLFL